MMFSEYSDSDRDLTLDAIRVTEEAALSASLWIGRGNEKAADQAAVDAMRRTLNELKMTGTIVIGEGERDQAPMLYVGESVGKGIGPEIAVALDPLEGTTITAKGSANALTVLALAPKGCFLHAPDVYMKKIAVGGDVDPSLIDLDALPEQNLTALAHAKQVHVSDLVVCILDRPRHNELIQQCRRIGARIQLIQDGDIHGVIATTRPQSEIDIYMGIGGAPEGVLAAAALCTLGGHMQARLCFHNHEEKERAYRYGITDLDRKYSLKELACGHVLFTATGVTNGNWLQGVRRVAQGAITHSVIMHSQSGTVRYIKTHHNFKRQPMFES